MPNIFAPDNFQTEDALEMVNAGPVDYTIDDGYLAVFWRQVLPDLVVHDDIIQTRTGKYWYWNDFN